jgi:hypothetical protein
MFRLAYVDYSGSSFCQRCESFGPADTLFTMEKSNFMLQETRARRARCQARRPNVRGSSSLFRGAQPSPLRWVRMPFFGTILLAVAGFAQTPEVKSWQNPGDGEVRTQITVRSSSGVAPPTVLLIECNRQTKREASIGIYLIAGPLEPHPRVGLLNPVSEWLLRMRLDDGKPVWRSWTPIRQNGTYAYEGEGEDGMASEAVSLKRFLKELLATKAFSVELQRTGGNAHVVSFDTSQLKQAFEARRECEAP